MNSRIAMSAISISLALLLSGLASSAHAQELYRWVDKEGKVHYSDMPPPADAKNTQQKKLGDNLIEQDKLPYAFKVAAQNYPVTLYNSDCGSVCTQARALLNKRGIPFTERNPQADGDAAKALVALVGGMPVPTLVVGNNKIKGFQENDWNGALDDAGYPANNPLSRPPVAPAKAAPVAADAPPPVPQ